MEKPYQVLYPMRVVLITSKSGGKENVMAAAWCFPLSAEPPLFGVSVAKKRFSYGLIREGKAFGINIVGKEMEKGALGAGRGSGRGKDKFTELGMGKEYGKLGIPLLKDSQASIECRLVPGICNAEYEGIEAEEQVGNAGDDEK